MGRSTFDGPILSGTNRFGNLRNTGSTLLAQTIEMDLANNTPGQAAIYSYGGASGQFVTANVIPNLPAQLFTPNASAFPPITTNPPTDTATNIYRGFVMYLPVGCDLGDVLVDVAVLPAVTGGTAAITSSTLYFSNSFTAAGGTPAYYATPAITAVGRQALATLTAQQITNQLVTSQDIVTPATQPNLSQFVGTLAIVGTALDTRATLAGRIAISLRYIQPDPAGSSTVYPYGNLD